MPATNVRKGRLKSKNRFLIFGVAAPGTACDWPFVFLLFVILGGR
jgi:hypothetical protein